MNAGEKSTEVAVDLREEAGFSQQRAAKRARILVIRGGALGDFILTLPALGLLRQAFADAHVELMGYPRIASLALGRGYVDALRSVDYGPMAGFYVKNGTLDAGLSAYFASFQQVVSYLYDPDGIFEENLRRVGVRHYLGAFRQVSHRHAAREWAAPLEKLALFLENPAAQITLTEEDRAEARRWVGGEQRLRLAIHPGSGSVAKNWPVAGWVGVARRFFAEWPEGEVVLVGGEADEAQLEACVGALRGGRIREARGLALPTLGGVLADCAVFAGHDTGVAHLAAAVGGRCVVLFGPTDPQLWAPLNPGVRVLEAPHGDWSQLPPGKVWEALKERLKGALNGAAID